MTADEIRSLVMQKESTDVREELALLCDIVSRLESEDGREPSAACRADGTSYDSPPLPTEGVR